MSLFSSLRFFVVEALTNCRRAPLMTAITVSTIGVALLLVGAFLLATMNVEAFLSRLQSEAMITCFLAPGINREGVNTAKLQVTGMEEVSDVQVVSPDEAVRELFIDPADQQLLEVGLGTGSNPLPWTLRLRIRASRDLDRLVVKLRGLSAIENVTYGEEAFRRFKGLSELLWIGSLLMIILLGLASLFIVASTISLTLSLRREEIIIMRLVGATNWFIRWPFVIEGMLQGVAGALLAAGLLLVSSKFILARLAVLVPFFAVDLPFSHLLKLSVKLGMMGIILGIAGSLISLRDLSSFTRRDG